VCVGVCVGVCVWVCVCVGVGVCAGLKVNQNPRLYACMQTQLTGPKTVGL